MKDGRAFLSGLIALALLALAHPAELQSMEARSRPTAAAHHAASAPARKLPIGPDALGATGRVSVASDGTQGNADSYSPAVSADALYVAFASDATNLVLDDTNATGDVFLRDRQAGETTRISVASDGAQSNGLSRYPAVTAHGQHVAFVSGASNLVAGDTNNLPDAFLHDRETGDTTRVSVASDGTQGDGQVNI